MEIHYVADQRLPLRKAYSDRPSLLEFAIKSNLARIMAVASFGQLTAARKSKHWIRNI